MTWHQKLRFGHEFKEGTINTNSGDFVPQGRGAGVTAQECEENLPLNAATINRVQEGLAAAVDPAVRCAIRKTFERLTKINPDYPEPRINSTLRRLGLRSLIRSLFRVRVEYPERIPDTAAILAVNHLHHIDPLLLLSELPTAPYYYILGDARTLYNKWWKRLIMSLTGGVIPLERIWKEEVAVMEAAKAGRHDLVDLATAIAQYVPQGGDMPTLRQIDRIVLGILTRKDSIILFPEGRLGNAEGKLHLPLKRGTVIYALRAGVPIVPTALIGTHDLYLRKELTIRFGHPLCFPPNPIPKRQEVETVLLKLQNAMLDLLPNNYQEANEPKLLRNFLNHMLW